MRDRRNVSQPLLMASECRAARNTLAWSQHELADKSGVSRITISRFESGNTRTEKSGLEALVRCFKSYGIVFRVVDQRYRVMIQTSRWILLFGQGVADLMPGERIEIVDRADGGMACILPNKKTMFPIVSGPCHGEWAHAYGEAGQEGTIVTSESRADSELGQVSEVTFVPAYVPEFFEPPE